MDEILYAESIGNYMQFVASTTKLLSGLTIAQVEALPPASDFIRVASTGYSSWHAKNEAKLHHH